MDDGGGLDGTIPLKPTFKNWSFFLRNELLFPKLPLTITIAIDGVADKLAESPGKTARNLEGKNALPSWDRPHDVSK
ncbi:hypothetical protein GWI33_016942 [Rhynchophorus ferrugineus]|uniref:Uncharacterized protein n=1 Tax=Rhynchophorus ferrugineus TaxID=354439 RepID=A0A834HXR3_RHYFE|nr:hypothetical protein GWI33_016942 [Rhynchophorus ferrugineus]